MRYLNKILDVQTFNVGYWFVYSSGKGSIFVDGEELSFPDSTTFYLIDNEIYSALDFYIDSNKKLIRPDHLKGLFYQNMYCGKIKLYTGEESMTYLFEDRIKNPVYKRDRNKESGNIIALSSTSFLIKDKNDLLVYSIINHVITHKIHLNNLISGDPVLYENKVIIVEDALLMYLYDKNWNDYSFKVISIKSGDCIRSSRSFGPNFFLHKDKVYSIGRNTQVIQVMNKNTFEIDHIDLSGELSEFVFETQCTPCFYKDELFVALKEKGQDIYSYWGVIDLNNYKLKFKTEMLRDFSKKATKNNKTFVSEIKANDKIVGVKVPGNILHIFEKET